jgi:hypothetical protein
MVIKDMRSINRWMRIIDNGIKRKNLHPILTYGAVSAHQILDQKMEDPSPYPSQS